jgi:hypothetical protein
MIKVIFPFMAHLSVLLQADKAPEAVFSNASERGAGQGQFK